MLIRYVSRASSPPGVSGYRGHQPSNDNLFPTPVPPDRDTPDEEEELAKAKEVVNMDFEELMKQGVR
jgi:hypothetical protein